MIRMKTMGIRTRGLALILSVASLIPLAILVPPHVRAAVVHQSAGQACAAVGAYTVGSSSATGVVPGGKTPQIVPPVAPLSGYLSGTVTLTAYTGCGASTSGRFQVHLIITRGPLPGATGSSGTPGSRSGTAIVIPYFNTGVVSATGTFQQDPAHQTDPEYMLVSGTVRYGPVGVRCTVVCTSAGSHAGTTVSRSVTFSAVTGYLQLQSGKPAGAGIMFLPPPAPSTPSVTTVLTPQPVSFWGTKTS
jgi:hypothetical protein